MKKIHSIIIAFDLLHICYGELVSRTFDSYLLLCWPMTLRLNRILSVTKQSDPVSIEDWLVQSKRYQRSCYSPSCLVKELPPNPAYRDSI